MPHGTYIALNVLPHTNKLLTEYVEINNIKCHENVKRHVTLAYSRNHVPGVYNALAPDIVHSACIKSFELFDYQDKRCLVMTLHAPSVVNRHQDLHSRFPLTFDHPEFRPHITLSYNVPHDFDVSILPSFDSPILLGEEYSEDLLDLPKL